MERVDNEGQVPTAKTLAHMLSVIPMAARGPVQLVMFDIHALQERFYFSHQVIPRLLSAIPLLIQTLKSQAEERNLRIAFPDEGAYKRFHCLFPQQWPTITCIKVRDGDKRVVRIKEGDPKGGQIVIVDDLVQTGGTLIECAKECLSQGAASVSAFVTHAVFPKESWKRFTPQDSGVSWQTFWITDSIPHAYQICEHAPFKMISISDAIVQSLLSYDLCEDRQ
jgi:phosphoribosylpyrophosphate synthetase